MKRTILSLILLMGIAVCALPGFAQTEPYIGIVESVEARVNAEVITTSEVDEVLQQVEFQLRRSFQSEREYERNREMVLERLIEESLLVQEARRRGIKMSPDETEAEIQKEIDKRAGGEGGTERLQDYLQRVGLTEDELRIVIGASIERAFLRNEVLRLATSSRKWITDEDIQQFKVENPRAVKDLEQADISHILIAVPEDALRREDFEARQKAERLVTEIRARGSDSFEQLAAQNSDHAASRNSGGRIGPIHRGELLKEFDVAFAMQPGEISEPIRSPQGYHIIKVNAKRSLPEVVRQYKTKKSIDEFVDRLRDNAVIVRKGSNPVEY